MLEENGPHCASRSHATESIICDLFSLAYAHEREQSHAEGSCLVVQSRKLHRRLFFALLPQWWTPTKRSTFTAVPKYIFEYLCLARVFVNFGKLSL